MIEISRLSEALKKDPALLEFARCAQAAAGTGKGYAPKRPVEALGEKRLIAYTVLAGKFRLDADEQPRTMTPQETMGIADGILRAETLFISGEVLDLLHEMSVKIQAAYRDSGDKKPTPKKLPFQAMFITTVEALRFDADTAMDAMLLVDAFTHPKPMEAYTLNFHGNNVSKGRPNQIFTDSLALFLEEKIVAVEAERPSRQMRKESERLGITGPDTISTLKLRAYEHSGGTSSGESDREYANQWLVRGHPRNQWMPSRQVHELRWIDPYVKGPEGAPFRERVIAAIR